MIISKLIPLLAVICLTVGCHEAVDSHDHDHDHNHDGEEAHSHDTVPMPPHGGTPVVVADDEFHLELVLDAVEGRMLAYVLDGHLESYVPVAEEGFTLVARVGDEEHRLNLARVPDTSADAPSGESSLFRVESEWLKSVSTFKGSIPSITLNGKTYSSVSFEFPKGTRHVH